MYVLLDDREALSFSLLVDIFKKLLKALVALPALKRYERHLDVWVVTVKPGYNDPFM